MLSFMKIFSLRKIQHNNVETCSNRENENVFASDFLCNYSHVEAKSLVENDNNGQTVQLKPIENADSLNNSGTTPVENEENYN